MRQEDITAALVQLKRIGNLLDDILDLTRQLAEAADREDQVTVRMLLAMRREPIEQLVAGEQQLHSQVAALPEEEGRQLADHLNGTAADDGGPWSQLDRQVAYNRRQHGHLIQLDQAVNRKISREKTVYPSG